MKKKCCWDIALGQVFLDYDHCILVMKEIGKFHALSYAAKKEYPIKFKESVSKLRTIWKVQQLKMAKNKFRFCAERGVLPLMNIIGYKPILKKFLKNYDDPVKFFTSLVDPLEPEAVLCHGDFCRNNMFFSYDNNKPVSVKFFDLQRCIYASPVIDLSFFLLLNTTKETREKHWDEFLDAYKDALKSVLLGLEIDIPELDFKRVAVYGFIHTSYFQPVMLDDVGANTPLEEYVKLTPHEQGLEASQLGGEKETQYLVDIIQFLLDRNYIRETYY